jgi:prepilin-type N-terminal cleavage/methylation domain-containing protein
MRPTSELAWTCLSRKARQAFSLVELLVVITIIVVLLALLTPALHKAIYQAALARCAANQRGVGQAAIQYAMNSRRFYPHRPAVRDRDSVLQVEAVLSNSHN